MIPYKFNPLPPSIFCLRSYFFSSSHLHSHYLASHADVNNACPSHQKRNHNMGCQCTLAPFFSMWHLGFQRPGCGCLGVYCSSYVTPPFIRFLTDKICRLFNRVHFGMFRATLAYLAYLLGNSPFCYISLRTPCTGGTSDVDSWFTLVPRLVVLPIVAS